ncbi:acyltransferase family protein [Myxacorys almedinensis]|uniref:Acyltransferase family protein n=1 Tax=Myxacorys almedinensis A TaxID=2690445 RepID=A0A8J7Z3Q1_9CYAN|nr:acyltransferase [Myxacorys almedinensis]NDJ18745.1 acyltransferase family protein [Myxacorys almedinensis A]
MKIDQSKSNGSVLSYMPQLDGLRSFAIFGVLITHYLQPDDPLRSGFPWGWLGVRLFFVLSGFLITGILISCRQKVDNELISPWKIIQNFYVRRCLRLFPIYYLYLALVVLIYPQTRSYIVAFIFYGQNFLFAAQPETFTTIISLTSHLWALAVEAQFYLILPWLVIFLPKRWLVPMLLAMILAAPVLRLTLIAYGYTVHQVNMMTPSHFDTLCMGGLLSALMASGRSGLPLVKKLMSIGLWIGIPLLLAYIVGRWFGLDSRISIVFAESGAGLVFVWLIKQASEGIKGFPGSVLNQKFLAYCGTVSYGLYIFHFEVLYVFQKHLLSGFNVTSINNSRILLPIYTIAAIAVAAIFWEVVEKPMNRRKRHFSLK